jgi:hypothetical protein
MAVIKIKRGTEAVIDAATLASYEIAYTTDTKKIVVFDGSIKQKYTTVGPQGTQGTTGAAGSQGTQGTTGAAGAQGNQGNRGYQGYQGNTGGAGTQGNTGNAGTQGNQGTTGTAGSQGTQGTTGAAGSQGNQGTTGAAGSQGNQGTTGAAGTQGNQGTQGTQGNVGFNQMDVVGGRLGATSTTVLTWNFLESNQIRLFNTDWELVKLAAQPTLVNTDVDLAGTALAVDKIYDVFAEYGTATALANTNKLSVSRWLVATAGASTRNAVYGAGTTYAIGDRVTYGGNDWVKISTAAAGTTPVAGAAWTDNGTSVTGDFAGLYQHEGVWCQANSAAGKKRRWLGVIYTYNNSATVNFKDSKKYRYVSNYYNAKLLGIGVPCPYSSSTTDGAASATYERWMGTADGTVYDNFFVCCQAREVLLTASGLTAKICNTVYASIGLGLNSSTVPTSVSYSGHGDENYWTSCAMSVSIGAEVLGYNFISPLQAAVINPTLYFYSSANGQGAKANTSGSLLC